MPPCTSELFNVSMNREKARTIFLSRHGESQNNLYGKIGGNAELSNRGEQYARALGCFINDLPVPCTKVLTSRLRRTQQTARYIMARKEVRAEIDEINAGDHDDLTYEEIAQQFPVEFAMRDKDKLNYRYPQGESYMDVVQRLRPIFEDLETEDNLLIISHQATIRCLLSGLLGTPLSDLPYLKIPLHTVLKLTIDNTGISLENKRIPVDCVDTYRSKPENLSIDRKLEDVCHTIPIHL